MIKQSARQTVNDSRQFILNTLYLCRWLFLILSPFVLWKSYKITSVKMKLRNFHSITAMTVMTTAKCDGMNVLRALAVKPTMHWNWTICRIQLNFLVFKTIVHRNVGEGASRRSFTQSKRMKISKFDKNRTHIHRHHIPHLTLCVNPLKCHLEDKKREKRCKQKKSIHEKQHDVKITRENADLFGFFKILNCSKSCGHKMATTKKKYVCIHCGHPIEELYTKYSASVTRIANCVRYRMQCDCDSKKRLRIFLSKICFLVFSLNFTGPMPRNCRQIYRIRAHRCCDRFGFIITSYLSPCTLQYGIQSKEIVFFVDFYFLYNSGVIHLRFSFADPLEISTDSMSCRCVHLLVQ